MVEIANNKLLQLYNEYAVKNHRNDFMQQLFKSKQLKKRLEL